MQLNDGPGFDKLCNDILEANPCKMETLQFLEDVVHLANQSGGWMLSLTPHVICVWNRGCRQPAQALAYARFMARRHEVAALERQFEGAPYTGPPVRLGQGDYERLEGDTNPGAPVAYVLGIAVIVAVTVVVCYLL
ncbi:MAG: hypothetical protein U1E51_02865 [Candidatus Binatia bacterium]|nr:hypothetical protein [Candidatus Binatia bacterium]